MSCCSTPTAAAVGVCFSGLGGACGSVAGMLRSDLLLISEMKLMEETLCLNFLSLNRVNTFNCNFFFNENGFSVGPWARPHTVGSSVW